MSEDYGLRIPPIPEEFTEKCASYALGYYHKENDGPDAFESIGASEKILPLS